MAFTKMKSKQKMKYLGYFLFSAIMYVGCAKTLSEKVYDLDGDKKDDEISLNVNVNNDVFVAVDLSTK